MSLTTRTRANPWIMKVIAALKERIYYYSPYPNKFNLFTRNFSIHLHANDKFTARILNWWSIFEISSNVFSKALMDMNRFKLFQINSIGFKSGQYGGRKMSLCLSLLLFHALAGLYGSQSYRVSNKSYWVDYAYALLKGIHRSHHILYALET